MTPSSRHAWPLGACLCVAVTTILLAAAAPPPQDAPPRLTVDRVASLPSLTGTSPSKPEWSPDGASLAFLWNDKGWPFRDVWVASAVSGTPTRVTDMATGLPSGGSDPNSTSTLAQRVADRMRGGVTDLVWTRDGKSLVFAYAGDAFRIDIDGAHLERLTRTGMGIASLGASPDGRFVSFLQEGDLWLWPRGGGEAIRATRVGVPAIGIVPGGRFSRLDREFSSYAWSPDSRHVALLYDDRTRVRKMPIPDYLGNDETHVQLVRRGYPGDNDEPRTIGLYAVDEGQVRLLELPDQTLREIASFSFSPDSRQLLVDENSEDGNDRWIHIVNVGDRSIRELWHDRGERRVTQFFLSHWQSDGNGIVFIGDLDDRDRLYALSTTGHQPTVLTRGDWDVVGERGTAKVAMAPARKEVFFVSTQKNPYERQVYRMSERGGPIVQVTSLPGSHEPFVSPDGSKVALLRSDDVTPIDLYIVDANGGTPERRLTRSPLAEFDGVTWARPRYVTFKSFDGFTLHARIMEPPHLDRTKRYPVILGSVYSNTVRNEWRGSNSTFQQFLAAEAGYINLQVDIRGSSGYGRQFREKFAMDWGGGDIEDLRSGVEYLKTLPYVDPDRIGIWGWSYGGTLVTFSLFKKPGLYRAGVAGAPAIDVAHFTTLDVHISKRPNVHPEVFSDDSSINFADGLRDHLMIVHGLQDDIVPFKTSAMLIEKLETLGKDFDVVLLPSGTHGALQKDYYGVFVFRKVLDYFDRYLGRGPKAASLASPIAMPRGAALQ